MDVCRICRKESDHLESLSGIREGLQISVLVMVICPVKIRKNDRLPKLICSICLTVVLEAFKLRDISIESDRTFKEEVGTDFFIEDCKPESLSPLPKLKRAKRIVGTAGKTRHETAHYEVDCFKKGSRSSAWDYFGRLVDENGAVVESEATFLFCKICVEEKNSISSRYRSENVSTGMLFQHLRAAHLEKHAEFFSEEEPFEPIIPPTVQGLTFTCPQENCGNVYKLKMQLEIHHGLEHTGIADRTPKHNEFHVSRKDDFKSMAWSYFGALFDSSNYEVVDDNHYYCRLCVGDGNLKKFQKTCSTTTLLHHLRDKHLTIKRTRKRFGSLELSSITHHKSEFNE